MRLLCAGPIGPDSVATLIVYPGANAYTWVKYNHRYEGRDISVTLSTFPPLGVPTLDEFPLL